MVAEPNPHEFVTWRSLSPELIAEKMKAKDAQDNAPAVICFSLSE
jgi:hypothetical protein